MKGQAQIFAAGATVIVVLAMTLIGLTIYGLVSDTYPHDHLVFNETICTTCVNGTGYTFDYPPVINDTTMVCYNNSVNLMTHGTNDPTCLGYNILTSNTILNITNTSTVNNCQISDLVCTYTYDEANTLEQSFFDNNTSVTFSGFGLLSIAGIVLAAIAIVILVLFLRG